MASEYERNYRYDEILSGKVQSYSCMIKQNKVIKNKQHWKMHGAKSSENIIEDTKVAKPMFANLNRQYQKNRKALQNADKSGTSFTPKRKWERLSNHSNG